MNKQSFSTKNKNAIIIEDIKTIVDRLGENVSQLSGKTVLITGGLGFIGRYLVGVFQYLNKHNLSKPIKIILIDNYMTSSGNKLYFPVQSKTLKFISHNIIKPLKLSSKIDYLVHAAGIASPIYYQKYPLETIDVAVVGTRNMLELAREKQVKSMLLFSSSEIYGDPISSEIPTKETYRGNVSSLGDRACYDESKRLGETLAMTYFRLYKTPVKIVRPFNIFGPGMKIDDYRVLPNFISNALNHKPLLVHEKGIQTRAFCYISDAVYAFLLVFLSLKDGEVYNVGNGQTEISMNQFAKKFDKLFDHQLKILNVSYPKNYPLGEPQRRCPDLGKIKEDLGYEPKIDLETGLKKTIEWCRNNWR